MSKFILPRITRWGNFTSHIRDMAANEIGWHIPEILSRTRVIPNVGQSIFNYEIDLPYIGRGVDYVVLEGNSILGDHPEWFSPDGEYRFVKENWLQAAGPTWANSFTMPSVSEYYNTRTHDGDHAGGTGSVAAGRNYGLAKGANVYCLSIGKIMRASAPSERITWEETFYMLRDWHARKTEKRPTVVSMGTIPANFVWWDRAVFGNSTRGSLRVSPDRTEAERLEFNEIVGIDIQPTGSVYVLQDNPMLRKAVKAAEDAGVHVFIPSGNQQSYVPSKHADDPYFNASWCITQTTGGEEYRVHHHNRGFYTDNSLVTGALDGSIVGPRDRIEGYSSRGRRIDLFVPAGRIPSTLFPKSNSDVGGAGNPGAGANEGIVPYPFTTMGLSGGPFFRATYSGTSAASPIAAGLGCCYLEKYPDLRPGDLRALLMADASRDRIMNEWDIDNFGEGRNPMHPEPLFPYYGLND